MSRRILTVALIISIFALLLAGCGPAKMGEGDNTMVQGQLSGDQQTSASIYEVEDLNENLEDEELGSELEDLNDSLNNW